MPADDGRVMAGYLAFTLFIGAARADADFDQLARLRAEVMPVIERLAAPKLPVAEQRKLMYIVGTRLQDIMGKDWQPRDEWWSQIQALIGEK